MCVPIRQDLNRPTPQGLCGTWRHTSEWIWLAHRAGLPAPRYVQSGRDVPQLGYQASVPFGKRVHPALVAAGRVFAEPMPALIEEGCRKLAELAQTEILGIDLFEDSDSLQFAGATPIPDLQRGGLPLLKHLAEAMQERRTQ